MQSERRLESQSIPRGKTAGHEPALPARYQQPVPEVPGIFRIAKNLKSVFAGVPGTRDSRLNAINPYSLRPVVRNQIERVVTDILQYPFGCRSLKRQQRIRGTCIMHFDVRRRGVLADPLEISLAV